MSSGTTTTNHRTNPASSILIKGGRVIDPACNMDTVTDITVLDGVIQSIGDANQSVDFDRVIDAAGSWVVPGAADLACNFREPGDTHKATIASETEAAAKNGITRVCLSPETRPVIDSPAVVELITQRIASNPAARVVLLGALTRELGQEGISNMASLKQAGCVGVAGGNRPMNDLLLLRRAMEYAADLDLTVHTYPVHGALANDGCAHEGATATRLGLSAIPSSAEIMALANHLAVAEQTGARLHVCRVSTKGSVELLRRALNKRLPITADVAMHQLFLTDVAMEGYDSHCHVHPPLRAEVDRLALLDGIAEGVICAITSDHQPHDADAKLRPFPATDPGASTLDSFWPLAIQLVKDGRLTIQQLIERVCYSPNKILGLIPPKLAPGEFAEFCIVNPEQSWQVTHETIASAGKNSPWLNKILEAEPQTTLIGKEFFHRQQPVI